MLNNFFSEFDDELSFINSQSSNDPFDLFPNNFYEHNGVIFFSEKEWCHPPLFTKEIGENVLSPTNSNFLLLDFDTQLMNFTQEKNKKKPIYINNQKIKFLLK